MNLLLFAIRLSNQIRRNTSTLRRSHFIPKLYLITLILKKILPSNENFYFIYLLYRLIALMRLFLW